MRYAGSIAAAVAVLSLASVPSAGERIRAEKWEIFFAPTVIEAKTLEYGHGAKASINGRTAFAFGIGYNFTEHLEVSVLMSSSSANYTGTRVNEHGDKESFTDTMYSSSFNLQGTYNFMEGPFTPYINGYIGSTYIDSGVPTGEEGDYCWWDPWWGYVCGPYRVTYTATKFSYGFDLGARYDFETIYVAGSVGKNFVDLDSSNGGDFNIYRFIFGFKF